MRTWTFAKGHGTENDFVLLLDRNGMIDPDPATVRYLCDRRSGIGGDGLLRVTPARNITDFATTEEPDGWFMDYRNADGSIAEMCGNGLRVFVRYLLDHDLAAGPTVRVGTRAGIKQVSVQPDGQLTGALGRVEVDRTPLTLDGALVGLGPGEVHGRRVQVGNPHLVLEVTDEQLAELRIDAPPTGLPAGLFPESANLEYAVRRGPRQLALRVNERGVGETRSCGTGTVAAAAAVAVSSAQPGGRWQVDVAGGTLLVDLDPVTSALAQSADAALATSFEAQLTGPAVIVAVGEVHVPERGTARTAAADISDAG